MTKEEKYETNEIELKDIPTDWYNDQQFMEGRQPNKGEKII